MVSCGLMGFLLLLNSFVFVSQLELCAMISSLARVVYYDTFSAVLWWRNTPRLRSVLLSRNGLKKQPLFPKQDPKSEQTSRPVCSCEIQSFCRSPLKFADKVGGRIFVGYLLKNWVLCFCLQQDGTISALQSWIKHLIHVSVALMVNIESKCVNYQVPKSCYATVVIQLVYWKQPCSCTH